jgi:hypothetical protein
MNILVSIDDTDSIDSRGTGELAFLLGQEMERNGWGKFGIITRHQLLVHPDVPYTSHNSSMCFNFDMKDGFMGNLTDHAARFLVKESAPGSDPGLCIAAIERIRKPELLIEFGRRAKQSVITMAEAVTLAAEAEIHLSSHGGTEQGIIGALAGVGLRLSGNDGRLRGKLEIPSEDGVTTVGNILSHPRVDTVRTPDGVFPDGGGRIKLVDKVKTVLLGGEMVLLVVPEGDGGNVGGWRNCTRQELKCY